MGHPRRVFLALVVAASVAVAAAALLTSQSTRPAMRDDITVHGQWTLEVRDPDGTVVARREFENALTSEGAATLSQTLARANAFGLWSVFVQGSPPLCGTTFNCISAEPAYSGSSLPNVFKNLTLSVPTSGTNAGKFVLSGSVTAAVDSDINQVMTDPLLCHATDPGCDVGTTTGAPFFTSTMVSPVVHVVAGQQILVSVVISFQ